MYWEITGLGIVGCMRGKMAAVVLRMVCSMLGLEGVSLHRYLEHGEVLGKGAEKHLGDHCCCSSVAGAVGGFAAGRVVDVGGLC